jgi:Rab GDP dissociation inhibitor
MKYLKVFSFELTKPCVLNSRSNDVAGDLDKPFKELLEEQKLTQDSVEVILRALAFVNHTNSDQITARQGLHEMHLHLSSLGRYCKSGFLAGIYGGGSELVQGFSRLSGVYGGTYRLDCPVERIERKEDIMTVQTKSGEIFKAGHVILSPEFLSFFTSKVELSR